MVFITVLIYLFVLSRLTLGSIEYVATSEFTIKDGAKQVDATCECGGTQIKDSISGDAMQNEFPWQVYIRVDHGNTRKPLRGIYWPRGFHDCGGTIINDLFILTTSGCILNFQPYRDSWLSDAEFLADIKKKEIHPSKLRVYLNIVNKKPQLVNEAQYQTVEKIYYHNQLPYPNLNSTSNSFDIAMLKLTNKLVFNSQTNISPVCLPPANFQTSQWNSLNNAIVGWYSKPFGKDTSKMNQLKKVKTGAIYNGCDSLFTNDISFPNYFCTSEYVKYMDAGSPFVTYTTQNKTLQLGILSWIVPYIGEGRQVQKELDDSGPWGLFSNLTSSRLQAFIIYHSGKEGARWCKDPLDYMLPNINRSKNYEEPWKNAIFPPKVETSCMCGHSKRELSERVLGGQDTIPFEFPWLVNLNGECAGSIINDRMILTAGHCIVPFENGFLRDGLRILRRPKPKKNVIVYGHVHELTYSDNNENIHPQGDFFNLTIQRIITYPAFLIPEENVKDRGGRHFGNNDIALIILKNKLNITDPKFNPVCIPEASDVINSYVGNVTLAGWGFIKTEGQFTDFIKPNQTQKIVMPLLSDSECRKYAYEDLNTDIFICAENKKRFGSSPGDSGGPLMVETSPGEYNQIGVVHGRALYTKEEAIERNRTYGITQIGLYTRVSAFANWISFHAEQYEPSWCKRKS